jgi:Protein of unknown function (DUF1217)
MIALLGLGSATLDYTVATKSKTQLSKVVASQPEVKANIDYYKENASTVKSVDDLLKNRKVLSVALGAYGLESQVGSTALLRKLLSEDPNVTTSLAQQMSDTRYLSFAKAFASLRDDGGASIGSTSNIDSVVSSYQETQYEKAVGRNDTAARQALYFARVAPEATGSIYQVLSDKTLSAVVLGAYGLPDETAALDTKQQVRQLQAKGFDYTKLSDEKYVKTLIGKFLASQDASGTPSGADEDVVVSGTASAAASMLSNAISAASDSNGIVSLDLSFISSGTKFSTVV